MLLGHAGGLELFMATFHGDTHERELIPTLSIKRLAGMSRWISEAYISVFARGTRRAIPVSL